MRPTVSNVRPLAESHLQAIEAFLGYGLPARLRGFMQEVNGGNPSPRYVPCNVYSGETAIAVYEFARWDDVDEFLRISNSHRDDLQVPARYLAIAMSDADTFYVDLEDATLSVWYFQYVEGTYESHFGGGPMDSVASSLDAFLESFFSIEHE